MGLLTIVIPTYNHANCLERRILEILPQIEKHPEINLIISDNASTDTTAEICQKYSVQRQPNPVNLGGNYNIFRSYLLAEGKWLWILGDDDSLYPNAIENILGMIQKHNEAAVIAFSSFGSSVPYNASIRSLAEYFAHLETTDVSFISSNLYNLSKIKDQLIISAYSIMTCSPHLTIILSILEKQIGSLELVRASILKGQDERGKRWSSTEVAVGISLIPEFVQDPYYQKITAISCWYKTRWMHKYGLREVNDPLTFTRWKRLCRTSNGLLKNYGASRTAICLYKWRSMQHLKILSTGIALFLIRQIPFFLLKGILKKFRLKHGPSVLAAN